MGERHKLKQRLPVDWYVCVCVFKKCRQKHILRVSKTKTVQMISKYQLEYGDKSLFCNSDTKINEIVFKSLNIKVRPERVPTTGMPRTVPTVHIKGRLWSRTHRETDRQTDRLRTNLTDVRYAAPVIQPPLHTRARAWACGFCAPSPSWWLTVPRPLLPPSLVLPRRRISVAAATPSAHNPVEQKKQKKVM